MNDPILQLHEERIRILEKKGHDYSAVIAGVPLDNLKITGLPGIAVRLLDKATRAVALTLGGKQPAVTDESLRDTLLDAGNYADLGLLLLDGSYDFWRWETGGHNSNPTGDENHPDPDHDPEEEEDEEEEKDNVILCFYSRNMFKNAEQDFQAIDSHNYPVTFYCTNDIHGEDALTPNDLFIDLFKMIDNSRHVHVVWDGSDMFIPMIVGMAIALDVPVSMGTINFPQGRPSRMHMLLNSLAPLVE